MAKLTKEGVLIISGGLVLFASGGAIGYFIANKRLKTKYEELAEQEIAEAKQFYSVLHKKDSYETPEAVVEDLGIVTKVDKATTALRNYQGLSEFEKETDPVVVEDIKITKEVHRNIFDPPSVGPNDFDFETELPLRTHEEPYIITVEEFDENEIERAQVSLTYYEGDDVLVDEEDKPIPDVDGTVGEANLQRFGYGARDNKMLYIRHEAKDLEFEIRHHPGKYTREVLGFIEHSAHRKSRRFDMEREE